MPNRLIEEKSPYLLQHAHNPVQWYPWGDEAFNKARQENKAEVAYTRAKYVRKPKKAKPGLVLVENEKSILVKPGLPKKEGDSCEM